MYYEPTLWKREIKKPFFNWVWTYEIFCLQPDLFLVCGNFISYVKKQNKCLFLLYPIKTNFLLFQTLNLPPRVFTVMGVNLKGKSTKYKEEFMVLLFFLDHIWRTEPKLELMLNMSTKTTESSKPHILLFISRWFDDSFKGRSTKST